MSQKPRLGCLHARGRAWRGAHVRRRTEPHVDAGDPGSPRRREGEGDVAILAYGSMVYPSVQAAEKLLKQSVTKKVQDDVLGDFFKNLDQSGKN